MGITLEARSDKGYQEITYFHLKKGQGLKNQATSPPPTKNSKEYPPSPLVGV